jgi:hypothetical protein
VTEYIASVNDLAKARGEASHYNGGYACRFCQHQVREHNRIEGCRFCTCLATPGEAMPQTDRDSAVMPLSPTRHTEPYVLTPTPAPMATDRHGDDLTGREHEALLRDVRTLLPILLSAELRDRWVKGSPAEQAIRDIQRILRTEQRGPLG